MKNGYVHLVSGNLGVPQVVEKMILRGAEIVCSKAQKNGKFAGVMDVELGSLAFLRARRP